MKSSMKRLIDDAASKSSTNPRLTAIASSSGQAAWFLHRSGSTAAPAKPAQPLSRRRKRRLGGHSFFFFGYEREVPTPPAPLRLVEERAALEQPRTLFRRHLDVPRRQQEDLVRNALHAAVERVREAAREIDQALREFLVGALEVQDHRDRVLEL